MKRGNIVKVAATVLSFVIVIGMKLSVFASGEKITAQSYTVVKSDSGITITLSEVPAVAEKIVYGYMTESDITGLGASVDDVKSIFGMIYDVQVGQDVDPDNTYTTCTSDYGFSTCGVVDKGAPINLPSNAAAIEVYPSLANGNSGGESKPASPSTFSPVSISCIIMPSENGTYTGSGKETPAKKPDPTPTPSPSKKSEESKPTEPAKTDIEIREAIEESLPVEPVTVDMTQFNKADSAVVPGTTYNLSNFITTKGIVKGINAAVTASNKSGSNTVTIYSGRPFCFNGEIIKTIQDGKKDVVYYFTYKGHLYSVTVPATVDASKVLEKAGFAGPLYVGQQLGTTRLIK